MKIESEVNQFIEKYSEEWLIAAIVDGSVGYYTPDLAKRLIDDWKKGVRRCYSERCMALYGCDLGKMLLSDFKKFEYLEKSGGTKPIIERVKKIIEIERGSNPIVGMQISAMYPTL